MLGVGVGIGLRVRGRVRVELRVRKSEFRIFKNQDFFQWLVSGCKTVPKYF